MSESTLSRIMRTDPSPNAALDPPSWKLYRLDPTFEQLTTQFPPPDTVPASLNFRSDRRLFSPQLPWKCGRSPEAMRCRVRYLTGPPAISTTRIVLLNPSVTSPKLLAAGGVRYGIMPERAGLNACELEEQK